VGGETGIWLAQLALVVVALIGVVLAGWVAASIISLVRDDVEGQRPSAREALRAGWAQRSAMVTAIVLLGTTLLLTGSLVLIPVAAFLVARWAVAPAAAVVEELPVRASLRRSAELTSGHRGRALLLQALLVFVGLSLLGLVGALLLIVTSWPFWVIGLLSIALLSLLQPVAFAGTTLQFYDPRRRAGQAAPADPDGTRPAPAA
jgi:MFS family permease